MARVTKTKTPVTSAPVETPKKTASKKASANQ